MSSKTANSRKKKSAIETAVETSGVDITDTVQKILETKHDDSYDARKDATARDVPVTMNLVISRIKGYIPSTGTTIKTLKDTTVSIENETTAANMSMTGFTEWLIQSLNAGANTDMEIEEAVLEVFSSDSDAPGATSFKIRCESFDSLKAALSFTNAQGGITTTKTDFYDMVSVIENNVEQVFATVGGVRLVAGGVEIVHGDEDDEDNTTRAMFRNGVVRVNSSKNGRPKTRDVTLFDFAKMLIDYNNSGAQITVLPCVEAAFEFGDERSNSMVVRYQNEMFAFNTAGKLIKFLRDRMASEFETRMQDGVNTLNEYREILETTVASIRTELGDWVRNLDNILPAAVSVVDHRIDGAEDDNSALEHQQESLDSAESNEAEPASDNDAA